ncbi:MAG: protein kinase [Bacteroidia bacterium]
MKTITLDEFGKRFDLQSEVENIESERFSRSFVSFDKEKGIHVALKVIPPQSKIRKQPEERFRKKLRSISHPHLILPHELFQVTKSVSGKNVAAFQVQVTEYFPAGNLSKILEKGVSVQDKHRILEGIMSGLEALHERGIVHGNLKPSNILILDVGHPHVYLTDFGYQETEQFINYNIDHKKNYFNYMAPEQLFPSEFGAAGKIDKRADLWSLGMIVYEMFKGQYLWAKIGNENDQNHEIVAKIRLAEIPKDLQTLPSPYRQIAQECLQRTVSSRPRNIKPLGDLLNGKPEKKLPKLPPLKLPKFRKDTLPKPVPVPVVCKDCGKQNPPKSVFCYSCGNPLSGPESLKKFKNPASIGFWAVFFYLISVLPIGIFYYEIYTHCDFNAEGCNISSYLHLIFSNHTKISEINPNLQIITPLWSFFFLVTEIFSYIFFIAWIWKSSNNLEALGSQNQRFHPISVLGSLAAIIFFIFFFTGSLKIFEEAAGAILIIAILVILITIFPQLILQEIWRGSNPAFVSSGNSWKKSKGSFMILSWWIMGLFFPVILIFPLLPDIHFRVSRLWFLTGVSLFIGFIILGILMVIRINLRQQSKYEAIAKHHSALNN